MNFLKRISHNKLTLPLFSFAILGFLFFPLVASAEIPIIGGFINAAQKDLVQAILGAIFGIMTSIPLMLLNVALDLLNWVASGNFLVVGFTNMTVGSVGYNPVVATGWSFVRNLANVVLIFGLVLIALSIILGYQETKAKKMLVDFILIAILINFTPVICGFAIDVAKIVMDLLLKGGVAPDVANFMASKLSNSNLADLPTMFVLAAFCIFSAVVYFLFALLFLVRVVMLWILIILSPIAFATKVLPQSRYIMSIFPRICQWDEWWTNFLQWTFMGIPAAGAIWLSNIAMGQIASNPNAFVSIPNGTALTGILGLLFSYTIPFIILVVGFFTTLDQGGAAGGVIKGLANKAWGATGGAAIGAAGGYALGRGQAAANWAKEGVVGTALGGREGIGTSEDAYNAREKGRKRFSDWKQRAKDKVVDMRLASPAFANSKSAAQKKAEEEAKNVDFDTYNKEKNRFSFELREEAQKKLIKQDTNRFLKEAGGDPTEYQHRLEAIVAHDDKSKEYKDIKIKALAHTRGNIHLAGNTDWNSELGIDLKNELSQSKYQDITKISMPAAAVVSNDVAGTLDNLQLDAYTKRLKRDDRQAIRDQRRDNAMSRARFDTIITNPRSTPGQIAEASRQLASLNANDFIWQAAQTIKSVSALQALGTATPQQINEKTVLINKLKTIFNNTR